MTKFTQAQQAAVEHSGHDILVSASAGSGKTTVLVARIISEVLSGVDLSRLLVVTFTDAAAEEMRDRIRQALEQQLSRKNLAPDQRQLLRQQLNRLDAAQISTLHAFCLQIIRKFYYLIKIDPSFRLLTEPTELELLREQVWVRLRDAHYDQNDEDFYNLAEQFGNDRSDQGLQDTVFQLYRFAITRPHSRQWLQKIAQDQEVEQTIDDNRYYRQFIAPFLQTQFKQLSQFYQQLQSLLPQITDSKGKLTQLLQANQQALISVFTSKDLDFSGLQKALATQSFPGRFVVKGKKYQDELSERATFKKILDQAKQLVQNMRDNFFFADEAQLTDGQKTVAKIMTNLVAVVTEFMQAYQQEKQRLKVLDFNDLEQFAWQLLQSKQDNQFPARDYYRQRFLEVMVDEYQDINPLQEAILQAVAQDEPGNRFMVGDVKQSIYGFRQADPSKFLDKYQQFKKPETSGERIILAENFRSTNNVNLSTNFIFQQLMHHDVAELDYGQTEALVTGAKDYPADLQTTTELLLFQEKTAPDQSVKPGVGAQTDPTINANSALPLTKTEAKIRILVRRIQELLAQPYQIYDRQTQQKRALTYQDIALLVPTRKNNLEIVAAIQQAGLPIHVADADNYFQTTEIRVMLAFLAIINNPEQDIPLATVLRSPIGHFDENDLARVRAQAPNTSFYQALCQYQEDGATLSKTTKFLNLLNGLRDYTVWHSISELVWEIYQKTGYLDYVGGMPGGLQRSLNLHALYQRAATYEKTSLKGLYQFITFIEQMQTHDQDLAQAQVGESGEDAIQLMTIHGSKGLEFPVVFVLDIDHRFNLTDVSQRKLVLDGQYGAGIKYTDQKKRVNYPTLIDSFIRLQHRRTLVAEEMRTLYVAMTRAKQKLILIGAVKDWHKIRENDDLADTTEVLLPLTLRDPAVLWNFQDMILPAILRAPQLRVVGASDERENGAGSSLKINAADYLVHLYASTDLNANQKLAKTTVTPTSATVSEVTPKLKQTIQTLLNFEYPYTATTQTTAYQSVSEIKSAFSDPDQFELNLLSLPEAQSQQKPQSTPASGRFFATDYGQPKFLTAGQKVTAAQIGTATHLLLQRLNLKQAVTLASLQNTCQRLVQEQLLTSELADKIDLQAILDFFETPLGQSLQDPENQVYREVPFSLLLSAQNIFHLPNEVKNDQTSPRLLVHGIIDGYIISENEVILFDYKTNAMGNKKQETAHLSKLTASYQGQLNLYSLALSKILARPVTHKYLYFLAGRHLVEV